MQYRNQFSRKTCFEMFDRLRSKRYFRHQHESTPAEIETLLNRLQIDLGFSASGHPMQQDRLSIFILYGCDDDGQSGGLSGVKRYRLRPNILIGGERITIMSLKMDFQPASLHQLTDRSIGCLALFHQIAPTNWAGFIQKEPKDLGLPWRPGCQLLQLDRIRSVRYL